MSDYEARLREQRQELAVRMRTVVQTAEHEIRDLSKSEDAELKRLDGDFERISADLARLQRLAGSTNSTNDSLRAAMRDADTRSTTSMSSEYQLGDVFMAEYAQRALSGNVVDGANVVSVQYADIIFDRLRANSKILSSTPGPTVFQSDAYQFHLSVGTASTSATAVGQGTAVATGDWGGTALTITPSRYGARTIFSNEFLQDITQQQATYFADDLLQQVAAKIDADVVQGAAPGFAGLSGLTGTTTVTAGTVVDLQFYAAAMGSAAVVNSDPTAWLMSATDYAKLLTLRTSGTATTFASPLLTQGNTAGGAVVSSMFGLPIITSSAYSAGTAFLVDMRRLVIVNRSQPEVFVDPYSLSSTYQTSWRITHRIGFGVPNPAGVVKITGLA